MFTKANFIKFIYNFIYQKYSVLIFHNSTVFNLK